MKDSWIRTMKGVTSPLNNSTLHTATRRLSRKAKGSQSLKGVERLVRLLPFTYAFISSDLKTKLLLRYLLMTFLYDVIIRVSFLSFSFCMFLRFGKAGWDCVTKDNIFICARYFLCFQVHTVSPADDNSRDTVFKTLFWAFSILLSIFENLYVFFIKR